MMVYFQFPLAIDRARVNFLYQFFNFIFQKDIVFIRCKLSFLGITRNLKVLLPRKGMVCPHIEMDGSWL